MFWLEVYLWGCIPAWPLSSYVFAHHMHKEEGHLDNEDLFIAIAMGLTLCWLWPLFIPGYWLWEWLHGRFSASDRG